MADAGIGATWRPSSASTSRACPAAGTLAIAALSRMSDTSRDERVTRCPRWPSIAAMPAPVVIGPQAPEFDHVVAVARRGAPVELDDRALAAIEAGRATIDALADDVRPHYGVSTGFGALATRHIPRERRTQLQRSVVRSHAAGSGPEVEREVVRALMLLRLSTLATGRTGVRVETAAAYAAMLDAGITPVVHEYGSLGCSGDLAPLSSVALALMGEGQVRDDSGALRPAADALAEHGIPPVRLAEKE